MGVAGGETVNNFVVAALAQVLMGSNVVTAW